MDKQFDAQSLALADETAAEVEVFHPATGQPTGIFITVMSAEDERAKVLQREMIDRRLNRMQRRNGKATLNAAELESEAMTRRVACTVSWRGMFWNGKELECTPENATMIYSKAPPIRSAVDAAIEDIALFTPG